MIQNLWLLGLLFGAMAQAGPRDGGGGDVVALQFFGEGRMAVENIQQGRRSEFDEVAKYNWAELFSQIRVNSVDHALLVDGNEVAAVNYPDTHRIEVNRARWLALQTPRQQEGLALHELLSLAGFEGSGNYVYSSLYLTMYGTDPAPVFGPVEAGPVPLPATINSIYSYQCRETFFQGEGVSGDSVSCPALQHLGLLFADYSYYLRSAGREDNFGKKQKEESTDGLICNAGLVKLFACKGSPARQFGLAKKRDGAFVEPVTLAVNAEVSEVQGFAALPNAKGACPANLKEAWLETASPRSVSRPYPSNFLNDEHARDASRVSLGMKSPDFKIWRQAPSHPCHGVSMDPVAPTGSCDMPDGPVKELDQAPFLKSSIKFCVVPESSLPGNI